MKTQLESLADFFRENVPERAMKGFSSETGEMSAVPAERDLGLGQHRMMVIRYEAQMAWERFPYRLYAPQLLMALLKAWVDDHGNDVMDDLGMTDAEPGWDVSVEDAETAVVVLTLPLVEELVIKRDANGDIPWGGERWSLADPEIWTAFAAGIYGASDVGAPVGED